MRAQFKSQRLNASGLAIVAGLMSSPALAQVSSTPADSAAAADASPELADEIVVTAQFREQNLQDTPIAITAINSAMMEARSQTTVVDAAVSAPNVQIREANAGFGNSAAIYIRGIGQYDVNFALEPGVGVYIDDVYHPAIFGAVFDLLDLDRVEILRGPQGTLAGKNSIGGAVKLYSKLPDGNDGGYAEATIGSYRRHDFRAGVNFSLIEHTLFMRLSGVYKKRRGHVRRLDYGCVFPASGVPRVGGSADCSLGRLGDTDFKGLRGSLRWTPDDRLEVTLIGDTTSDDARPGGQVLIAGAFPSVEQFVPDSRFVSYATFQNPATGFAPEVRNNVESWGVSGRVVYELSDQLELTSVTARRSYSGSFVNDAEGGPGGPVLEGNSVSFKSFTQEVRLNASLLDDRLNITLGGYYYEGDANQGGRVDIGISDFISDDDVRSDSKSGFAHVELRPIPRLSLSAGLRYTDESKSYEFTRKAAVGPGPAPIVGGLDGISSRYEGDRWDYRLNAAYEITDNALAYATYSTGFRGGGVNPRPYTPAQAIPFQPETLDAYEIGLKTDVFDRRLRLNLSGFINQYDGILLTILNGFADFPLSAIPLNAGTAKVKGVELETTARPIEGLLVDGSVGYIDFEYESLTPAAIASGIDLSDVAPFTPKWKATLGAQYEVQLGAGASLTPRLDLIHQTSFYTNADSVPTARTPGYTVFNGRLTPNFDRDWEVALAVTNIADKFYYTNVYDNTAFTGAIIANVARPREWALSVKRRF